MYNYTIFIVSSLTFFLLANDLCNITEDVIWPERVLVINLIY